MIVGVSDYVEILCDSQPYHIVASIRDVAESDIIDFVRYSNDNALRIEHNAPNSINRQIVDIYVQSAVGAKVTVRYGKWHLDAFGDPVHTEITLSETMLTASSQRVYPALPITAINVETDNELLTDNLICQIDPHSLKLNQAGGTEVGENGGIGWIQDRSGNANHFTQVTASFRPNRTGNYIDFDGIDDRLVCNTINVSTPVTMYARVLFSASQSVAVMVSDSANSVFFNTSSQLMVFRVITSTVSLSVPVVSAGSVNAVFVADGANSYTRYGDNETSGATWAGTLGTTWWLGGYAYGSSFFSPDTLVAFLLYDTAHDAGQRANVLTYLETL